MLRLLEPNLLSFRPQDPLCSSEIRKAARWITPKTGARLPGAGCSLVGENAAMMDGASSSSQQIPD
jgi:hypothetical protein